MPFHRLDRWLDYLTGPQLILGIVWLGMVCVTLTLLLMMVTRWGQSQPLKKCVILSLLTHALLATYATTVEIVGASPGEPVVHATIVDTDPTSAQEGTASPSSAAKSTKPWDHFGGVDVHHDVEHLDLDRPEAPAQPSSLDADHKVPAVLPNDISAAQLPAAEMTRPDPRSLAEDDEHLPVEAGEEESIEAPVAVRREARDPALAERAGPAKTATPTSDRPPVLSSASPGLPGELADVPSLPRMVELPAAQTGPLSPSLADDRQPRSDTPLDAESLGDAVPRKMDDEFRRESNVGSIVDRATSRATDARSPTAERNDLLTNPLSAPHRAPSPNEPAEAPRAYENRRAPHKAEIIAAHGGSPVGEAAVKAALQWLAAHQHTDGSWDASRFGAGQQDRRVGTLHLGHVGVDADNGVTALALLAFLGNGQTHLEGEYRETVDLGLRFLLSTQSSNGSLSGAADPFAMMYCHGMAALAISEAYAMTQDERLLPPVRKAIAYTLAAQHPTAGGWRYKAAEPVCDTSQLGWQLMALKSAELAGIEMPLKARQGMLRFLQTVSSGHHGGLASYRPLSTAGERVTPSMTAEALVCRQFLGLPRSHPANDEAGNYLAANLPGQATANFYYWYYATLAMFQLQGEHWQRWKNALEPTLFATQRTEGELAGSWDPDPAWGGHGGRVYSTALGALCLEVYYRFLPLYVQASSAERDAK
ncbi:MAG TPA: hypothetical protein VHC22_01365 [Pirellulales bacterium]|nr:hypothetical protein [Pirellulales bacterium]